MSEQPTGPVMLAATAALRGHKTRIGKIAGNITLPRTVPLANAIAFLVGGVIGLIAGAIIGGTLQTLLYGTAFGGAAGVFAVTYSPLKGESLMTWLGLTVNAKRQQIKVNGQAVRLAIGVAYISQPARGNVSILGSAIDVDPEQFDERGVLISAKNRNLPRRPSSRQIAAAGAIDVTEPATDEPVKAKKPRKSRTPDEKVPPARKSRIAAVHEQLDGPASPQDPAGNPAAPAPTPAPTPAPGPQIHEWPEPDRKPSRGRRGTPKPAGGRIAAAQAAAGEPVPDDFTDPFAGSPKKLPRQK
jgi:hypothetical protein